MDLLETPKSDWGTENGTTDFSFSQMVGPSAEIGPQNDNLALGKQDANDFRVLSKLWQVDLQKISTRESKIDEFRNQNPLMDFQRTKKCRQG